MRAQVEALRHSSVIRGDQCPTAQTLHRAMLGRLQGPIYPATRNLKQPLRAPSLPDGYVLRKPRYLSLRDQSML